MSAVYLDNGATTRVPDEVARVIRECLQDDFGNPSSAHAAGVNASRRLRSAREHLLAALGDERGSAGDVLWTSGGTEADALGVMGGARALRGRGRHIVLTALEHSAVSSAVKLLEAEGYSSTVVAVGKDGVVDPAAVADAVTPATSLVACMLVQNELGTIQPVAEVARAARARRAEIQIHCDAVQALGKLPLDVRALGVDTLAVSAHKLHGPKGVGALWTKKGARLAPLWGGSQQGGLRAGTENVAGIAGFGEAVRLATANLAAEAARVAALSERLVAGALALLPGATQNGASAPRVPHIASIAFPGLPAEPLLHALEARGVYVSAGSACASKSAKRSSVLAAIGVRDDAGVLRFSFSRESVDADVDAALAALAAAARDVAPPAAKAR
jgi:cysteine desulfurase